MAKTLRFTLWHLDAEGVIVGVSYFHDALSEEERQIISQELPDAIIRDAISSPHCIEVFVPQTQAYEGSK